ncbi:MAG: hypothetical protein ABI658_31745 [Acidimicrobiales bacterium]
MKKLVLGSLMAVLVSQAAGCIITTDGGEDYALINVEWDLKTAPVTTSQPGHTIPCPPGTTTAAVYAQAVDTSFRLVGSPFIDLYNCDIGAGTTDPLPPDVYQTWVELTSEGGGNVYATSTSLNEASPTDEYFVNVLDFDQTFATTILADGGYFQFDWDLRNAANQPITCASVPKVALFSVDVNDATRAFDDRFPCDKLYGLTGGLLQGGYQVKVTAINSSGQGLGPDTVINNRAIAGPNKVTDLGSVMVQVD